MTARDPRERARASSPLELLFDLTFVVAVSSLVAQLAIGLEHGNYADIGPFLMVFFAIWWAWMNFTWFASAFDTDDVLYRVLTMLQMVGVLILAAGVPTAFSSTNYAGITIGYLVMRIGLVAQWSRAAVEEPATRTTAIRFAVGVSLVQVGWVSRLWMPASIQTIVFLVLVLLEVSVPFWAERTGMTRWHPHHIAERYGLFTIILLGESVLAATSGVQAAIAHGVSWPLVTVAVSGVVILFALWWLFFLEPSGDGLERHPGRSFFWGYGHYFIFAALAAIGAGLEVAVRGAAGDVAPTVAGFAVAIPVAVFILLVWLVNLPVVARPVLRPFVVVPGVVVVLSIPLAATAIGLTWTILLIALVCVGVVAGTIAAKVRHLRLLEQHVK
jgi:low temperature requirement protein LtrA